MRTSLLAVSNRFSACSRSPAPGPTLCPIRGIAV